jgi:Family of unknown function (DUF5652)
VSRVGWTARKFYAMGHLRGYDANLFNIDAGDGLVLVVLTLLPLVGIVDALAHSTASWRAARRSRFAWVLIQLLLNAVGVMLYFLVAHPSVSRRES